MLPIPDKMLPIPDKISAQNQLSVIEDLESQFYSKKRSSSLTTNILVIIKVHPVSRSAPKFVKRDKSALHLFPGLPSTD